MTTIAAAEHLSMTHFWNETFFKMLIKWHEQTPFCAFHAFSKNRIQEVKISIVLIISSQSLQNFTIANAFVEEIH